MLGCGDVIARRPRPGAAIDCGTSGGERCQVNDVSRRLERDPNNKMIGGVAAGVANYFNLDPTVVRIAWAASILVFGMGLLLYLIMWIVMPVADSRPTST